MALQTERVLDNGLSAHYHMITDVIFSKRKKSLTIFWVGFKDEVFRKEQLSKKEDNTDQVAIYKDSLKISGIDFKKLVEGKANAGTYELAYELLREKISYLKDSVNV